MRETSSDYAAYAGGRATRVVLSAFLLMLLIGSAAGLRFYHLSEQGILCVDEGRYVLDAVSQRNELEFVGGLLHGKYAEMRGGPAFHLAEYVAQGNAKLREQHPFAPKPGYAYLAGALMWATGDVLLACSRVEAICGTLMVLLLFGLLCDLRGARAGLIAAAFLSFSAYHIYFSRNAYPQTCAGALFILAIWCHYRWYKAFATVRTVTPWFWCAACGFFAALSFWFNYQVAGALPAILVLHILISVRVGSPRRIATAFFGGSLAVTCGFLSVMILAEAWTYPLILLFRNYGYVYPHQTFFELLLPRLFGQANVSWNAGGWQLFFHFLTLTEGQYYVGILALPIFVGADMIYRAVRWPRLHARLLVHPALLYAMVPLLVAYTVFSFKTMQGARMFTTALPFLFAVIALGIDYAFSARRQVISTFGGALGFLLVNLIFYLPNLNEILSLRSAYPEVVAFARAQEPPAACAAWSAVLDAYGVAEGLKTASVYRYIDEGRPLPTVYVSDWQELYNERTPEFPAPFEPGAQPVKEFAHTFGKVFLGLEAFPSFGDSARNIAWTNGLDLQNARRVLIYNPRVTPFKKPADIQPFFTR